MAAKIRRVLLENSDMKTFRLPALTQNFEGGH
jgi:hypothetical protein